MLFNSELISISYRKGTKILLCFKFFWILIKFSSYLNYWNLAKSPKFNKIIELPKFCEITKLPKFCKMTEFHLILPI